jgi:hypothetical protein
MRGIGRGRGGGKECGEAQKLRWNEKTRFSYSGSLRRPTSKPLPSQNDSKRKIPGREKAHMLLKFLKFSRRLLALHFDTAFETAQ